MDTDEHRLGDLCSSRREEALTTLITGDPEFKRVEGEIKIECLTRTWRTGRDLASQARHKVVAPKTWRSLARNVVTNWHESKTAGLASSFYLAPFMFSISIFILT